MFLSYTASAQIPAKDCSAFTPDYYVPAGSPVNLSSLVLTTPISNKTFILDDDLIIDKYVSFQHCLFKVAPGKRIKIITSSGVYFYECNLYSCGGSTNRWFGIELASATTSVFTFGKNKIENALNAILIENKSVHYFNCNTNDFYDNYIGIYIKGTTEFKTQYNFGNKFHGLAVSPLHSLPVDQLPAYGIKIEGLSTKLLHYDIGNYYTTEGFSVTENEFYNLYISGVQLDYAFTQIKGSRFSSFFDVPWTSYVPIEGAGVCGYNSDFSVTDISGDPYPRCSFTSLDYGIYFAAERNINVGISSCDFSDCASYGIQGWLANPAIYVSLTDNIFNQVVYSGSPFYAPAKTYTCIRIDGTSDLLGIDYNEFNSWIAPGTAAPLAAGFQVFLNGYGGGGSPQPDFGTILGNTFDNSQTGSTHFYMANYQNTEWMVMESNTFTGGMNANYTTNWQAAFFDCNHAFVRFNQFNDSHATDNIHFQGIYNYKFCQNNLVSSVNVGVHAYYNNAIELAKTQFGTHNIGLYLDKIDLVQPVIGLQPYRENCWAAPGTARNDASTSFFISLSQFTVNAFSPCFMPGSITPPGWFIPGGGTTRNTCEREGVPGLRLMSPAEDLSWEAQYEWYKIISERGPQSDYESELLSALANTGIPQLVSLETKLAAVVNTPRDDYDQLISYKHAIDEKYAAINAITENAPNGNLSTEDSIQIELLSAEVNPILQAYTDKGNSVHQERQAKLTDLNNEINALGFSGTEEKTYQKYLDLASKARISGIGREELDYLAEQLIALDPLTHGHGARKAIHFASDPVYLDYIAGIAQTCKHRGDEIRKPQIQTAREEIAVPVKKAGKNIFEIESISGDQYSVLDLNGKQIQSGRVNRFHHYLDLSELNPGLYYLQLSGEHQAHKLMIEP